MRGRILILLVTLLTLLSSETPAKDTPSLHVAAVQMRSTRELDKNVTKIETQLEECANRGVEVAVFPECALTGYFGDVITKLTPEQIERAEAQVAAACKRLSLYAVVGTPHYANGKLFNSATVFTPTGKVLERYHKVQLAEDWPVGGDHLSVFPIRGVPCSIIICHDERYPELVRLPVLAGARVIFYLSHESGVRSEHKLHPYRAQIQARAVENGVFIVHANAPANDDLTGSHGQSRIIAPDGNLIGPEADIFAEQILTAKLELPRATASNALKSIRRGPFGDWWREGVARVRIIKAEDAVAIGAAAVRSAANKTHP